MTDVNPTHEFSAWIEKNRDQLRPPVNNKLMWTGTEDFLVQVVGGPNERTDFHVDPYEEWFYQLRGTMHVNIMTEQGLQRIDIGEGETWLLPRSVPHSPQRPEPGSVGLVVERIRPEGVPEKFQWYCENCGSLVHEVELQVRDLVVDMPPVFEAFYQNLEDRTCPQCGTVHPGKKVAA